MHLSQQGIKSVFKKLGHKPDIVAVGIVSVDLKVLRRARPKSMRFLSAFLVIRFYLPRGSLCPVTTLWSGGAYWR